MMMTRNSQQGGERQAYSRKRRNEEKREVTKAIHGKGGRGRERNIHARKRNEEKK